MNLNQTLSFSPQGVEGPVGLQKFLEDQLTGKHQKIKL